MKMDSFWQVSVPAFELTQNGELPNQCSVLVVGGGFTGLSTALNLAKSGVDVVLVEKDEVISEGSGRNGGHCNTGVAQNLDTVANSVGLEKAINYYHCYEDAVAYVKQLVDDYHIDCDFKMTGKLKLAAKPSHVAGLRKTYELMKRTVDPEVEIIEKSELRNEVDSDAFFAGLLLKRSGQMHMGKFGNGLAKAAVEAGAKIFPHCKVNQLERISGNKYRVITKRGEILADKVMLATGCSNDGPFPWLQRRIVPVGSFIITTEPLSEMVANSLLPKKRTYVTTKNIHHYFHLSKDNRLIFGGRARFAISDPVSDKKSGDILQRSILKIFPNLQSTKIDYCWGGMVDMSADRLPRAGEHKGLFYSLGYSGHGTQMSTYMGKVMADYLIGRTTEILWQRGRWPALPGYFGTPWFLPLAGLYYRAKDVVS